MSTSKSVNVKVAVRCRPLSTKENGQGSASIVTISENRSIHVTDPEGKNPAKDFTFDHAYFTASTQEQVYDDLGKPTIDKAFEGFNGNLCLKSLKYRYLLSVRI